MIQLHDAFVVEIGNGIETFDRRRGAMGAGIDKNLRRTQPPLSAAVKRNAEVAVDR